MKIRNNLLSLIFQDFDNRYIIELIIIAFVSLSVYFSYDFSLSVPPYLNYGYHNAGISYYFNRYLYYASYPFFYIFYIVTIIISSYEIFLFSSSIVKNKFIVIFSMGFKKSSIILSYFIMFVLYPLLLLCISYFIILYVYFLSPQYHILYNLILFTFMNLMFFISIGILLSVLTKNSLMPSAFILIFFYLLVPFIYIKPENTLIYHIFDSTNAYLRFGFDKLTFNAIIIEFLLSIILVILSIFIANYRDMKVVR